MKIMDISGTIIQNAGSYQTRAMCKFIYKEMNEKYGKAAARDMTIIYAATRYSDDANTFEEFVGALDYIRTELVDK